MKRRDYVLLFLMLFMLNTAGYSQLKTEWWLTKPDKSALLKEQPPLIFHPLKKEGANPFIIINPEQRYQTIDGFGFALTGGSAQHIINMTAENRKALLMELFGDGKKDIDISYLRVSIGSSDLNDHTFSYDDLPPGKTDPTLKHFNLAEDKKDVIPALKEILAIDPSIKILGSPWSAPVWMKTNHNIQGGMLERKYYPVYAKYFVKYIRAMKKNGITIDAVTIQNEPFNNGNTPSMQIFAKQELDFVKNYLGPAFQAQGIRTKIIIYDHNCDAPEYPISILTDTGARKYIDGSAFHLYAGNISALTKVHHAFPRKNVYLTEMMAVSFGKTFPLALPESKIVIGAMRNWSKNVILWNLAANSHFEPHTNNGGCSMCQGAITIDKNQVSRNIAYYMIAHASKFVPPHSVRIGTNTNDSLSNVAFRTPTGKIVLLVANVSDSTQKFNIIYKGEEVQPELGKGEVATFVW
jgi:glucosylceramidase